jgi:CPA2 family monovalent cation:H+ antiporter-2
LLASAGLAGARALVITFRQSNDALQILEYVTAARPGLPVLIRAAGDTDLDRLLEAGATAVVPEAMETSLALAARLLLLLGMPEQEIGDTVDGVREDGYRPLRGFIPGQTPLGKEGSARYEQYLHAVPVVRDAWVIGGSLAEIDLARWGVMVSALRRDGIKVAEPIADTRLRSGDVLILTGTKQALQRAEGYLRKGHRQYWRRAPVSPRRPQRER